MTFFQKKSVYSEVASSGFLWDQPSWRLFLCYSRRMLWHNKHCLKQIHQRSHNHEDDSVENEPERESLRPRNFPPWDWPKDVLTSVSNRPKSWCHKWCINTENTPPSSPVRAQHQRRSLYKHWRAGSCFWQPRLHKIMPLDNPKFPKSQFPRQITSWLPSRNPQLPRTSAAACTAISPAAVQLTIWWEKNEGKKHCIEARTGILPNYRTFPTAPWATISP